MKKVTKVISAAVAAAALTATMAAGASAEKAGLNFQLANYIHRDSLGQTNATVFPSTAYLEENGPLTDYEGDETLMKIDSTFTDADVTADGTYDVKITTSTMLEGTATDSGNVLTLGTLFEAEKYPDLEITINTVTIGDKTYDVNTTFANPEKETENSWESAKPTLNAAVPDPENYAGSYIIVTLFNNWPPTKVNYLTTQGEAFSEIMTTTETLDISVNFTVAGLGAAAEEPAESETPADTDAPATEAPTTGDSSKPSTNTGAEGIALAAGVAVLATGAAIVAKKRK